MTSQNRLTFPFLEQTSLKYNPWKYLPPFASKCPYGSEMSSLATHFPVTWIKESGSIEIPEYKEMNRFSVIK